MFVDLYPGSRSSPSVIPPSAQPSDLPGGERELGLIIISVLRSAQLPPPSSLLPPNFDQPLGKNNIFRAL